MNILCYTLFDTRREIGEVVLDGIRHAAPRTSAITRKHTTSRIINIACTLYISFTVHVDVRRGIDVSSRRNKSRESRRDRRFFRLVLLLSRARSLLSKTERSYARNNQSATMRASK